MREDRKGSSFPMTGLWLPYCGAAPIPDELLARWNFDPSLVAGLLLIAGGYWHWSRPFERRRRLRFAVAWLLLVLLYVSPFCALGSALFSARAIHHVVLIGLVAPLLVGAVPLQHLRIASWLVLWTSLQAVVLWFWHAPAAYAWALSGNGAFWLMQLSLLSVACAFWAALRASAMPGAVAALLATMVQMGLLGALITFAGAPLYAPHYLTTATWGYSPLQDQQAAGLVMWAPAAAIYLLAALWLAGRWLGHGTAPQPVR